MIQILVLTKHLESGTAKGTKMINDKITQAVAEAYKKMKQEELKGDQHKIDANKNGQIDAHDFKILRGQKNEETEPKTEKEKNLAALGHPKDKITHKDVLIGRGVIKKEEWDSKKHAVSEADEVNELSTKTLVNYATKAPQTVKRGEVFPKREAGVQTAIKKIAARATSEETDSKKNTMSEAEDLNEDLRNWFKPDHPEGGWKRINSKGEAIGPCAREPGEPKPKCMSNEKRASLTKKERAAAVAAKRRHDPNPERKGAPINVSNFGKGKISESVEYIEEKNAPTNPELWSRAKALAKQKFDVYPSAYANGWASKWYKSKGGGWKTVSEELELQEGKMAQLHADIEDAVGQHVKDYNAGKLGHDSFGEKVVAAHQKISKLHGIKPEHAKKFVNDYVDQNMKEEVELTEGNDDVGEMIKDKLKIIINRAKEMHDGIGPNTDMPEWVKSKITLAQDYVSTACDYSCGSEQLGEEAEQVDERCWDGYKPVQGKEAYSKGSCTKEEEEIQEDMGEPDIKVRSTYTKAYADHYKHALRLNPKGASKRAQVMAYDTVKAKHGEDATNALRAFHDKNQNEGYQLDEELSSRAKLVKELFNKAKEKKSKKDVFEADPEMEIMPSPQYAQPKK